MLRLVAQAGHVGRTTGATGTAGEQQMTWDVCAWLYALTPPGWECLVIDADEPDSKYAGDAFVAVHGDGSTNRAIRGASVGYRNSAGQVLAQRWKAAYNAAGWPGGWHLDNYTAALSGYYGLLNAVRDAGNEDAFILEVGMMTNDADRAWIDANHETIARTIWSAVAGMTGGDDMLVPAIPTLGFVGLHRFHKGKDYVLAVSREQQASADGAGYTYDGVYDLAPGGTIPLHQLYLNGKHLYVADDVLPAGWPDQGVLVMVHPVGSGATMHRLLSGGDHLYSTSATEGAPTWTLEGPLFGLGVLAKPSTDPTLAKKAAKYDRIAGIVGEAS